MKKKILAPRRKRMTRHGRLESGKKWILKYTGKRIISGYAKWFAVDKICAIKELRMLGIDISEDKERQIVESTRGRIKQNRANTAEEDLFEHLPFLAEFSDEDHPDEIPLDDAEISYEDESGECFDHI